ncbi:MAG: right-handed parallel beta-helix repeat-containing protein [Actinophytocola sp.]|uniref:hypothetical protein n=1 Tax=Actinophytocola sp. TaxID=1872138 RepID=UPI003C73BA25
MIKNELSLGEPEPEYKGQDYYVDSTAGDDRQAGTSPNRPWKTLDKINQVKLGPGDRVLFRRGRSFSGTFAPVGSGTANNPIIATSYGSGAKPVIDGQGSAAAIFLHNVDGWELKDLEVTNFGPAPASGQRAGVFVLIEDFGVGEHYVVANVDVHDVNGPDVLEPIPSGGIIFVAGGTATPTGFDGITVRNCTVSRVDRMGICTQSLWSVRPSNPNGRGTSYMPMNNIVIKNNRLEKTGGDGIMLNNGVGALVEHNVLDDFGGKAASGSVVGIYGFNCDQGLFRHNRVANGRKNSMAFDIETGNHDTVYEYNHTYRNNGGFLLCCNDPTSTADNAIIRYNVSYDDRDGDGDFPVGVVTLACGVTKNLRIHNNTFYAPNTTRMVNNIEGTSAEFTNNIFVGRRQGSVINDPHGVYRNNLYHNVVFEQGSDTSAVEADPLLVAPDGARPLEEPWSGQLRAGSPAWQAAAPLTPNGNRDHAGETRNIGAFQGEHDDR